MIGIVRLALARPYTFVVMAMLIMIFGVMAALRTPTDIFPDIKIPVIAAVWSYSGLPPDEMSGRIISVYERSLTTTVNDIEHIESQSLAGYGIVKIFFQPNVNINTANAQVTAISQTVLKQMPAGITPPIILNFSASSVPILQVALSSKTLSEQRLADTALNVIRPPLVTVPGAALPYPYGGKSRQMQIDLDQSALRSYGLAAQDVVQALTVQNLITPVGTQKIGKFEYTISLNDAPKRLVEFRDLPIKVVNGTVVYMRDVANVHDASPPQMNVVQLDGQKGVLMSILKTGSASTLDIIAGIKAALPAVKEILPPGLDLKLVGDQSAFVEEAVSGVIREGIIAAALTGLMILIFLGSWRSTLIITVSIPLAILASITVLSMLGETINVMTLGGLALAVGILVDDATVTIENINWHMEQGKPIETAILDGAQQIVVPATVSLLCICIAFVPMFGLGGVAGYLFRPLAEAVVFAMIASYILSRTLVPTMANFLLRNQGHHGAHGEAPAKSSRNPLVAFQRAFERGFEAIRSGYVGLLHLGLRKRVWLNVGFLVVSGGSFALVPYLGSNFFPDIDSGEIKLHIRAQTGTRVEATTALASRIEGAIRAVIPPVELRSIVANIGLPISGINVAYGNSGTIGVGDADILISMNEEHGPTAGYVRTLREQLPRQFPGTVFSFLPADIVSQILNFGSPAPIDLQIAGPNLEANRAFANTLASRMRTVTGLADVRVQQAFQQPTLYVGFNRTLAGLVGLTEQNAATSMLQTLAGSSQTNPIYWLNPDNQVSYPVSIQTPQYAMDRLEGLRNLPLAANGNSQLLGGLARFEPTSSNAVISHYNIQPVIDIYGTPTVRDLGAVATDVRTIMDEMTPQLPRGSRMVLRGQVATMLSAYQQLFIGIGFAIVLIYLLIVVNFQSWLDPFVIVLALPTALAGIVWMLFGTGTTLSVPALTGAIMCMGVATANSILVISFARDQLATGMTSFQAALAAGSTRFRPVLMTALAMVIGMAPMAIEPGQNAPLGRAVIGGLVFATFATLFFVPALFSLVHARDHARKAEAQPRLADGAAPA
ncbi:efflux RND transporter permease subunit [Chelatococcus reniformis]|uniref:RND transporter n=1 Tax=Chelatococcus reniformis TaxID=1494448 RepID=A0A916UPB7_9HYPH|nr:efflux RND transporter permease subunit [Chelatococcus reniformis]GGC80154.1 RND transporter [Chelatococcus reniformis]